MAVDAITNLYQTVKGYVTATKIDEVEVVSYFGFWNNNDLDSAYQAIKRDVAVFFSISGALQWSISNTPDTNALNQEQATCEFTLRVARKSLKNDEAATLELLAIRNCIHRNLIGRTGDNFGFIKRVGEIQDITHNNVMYWEMKYTCDLYEEPTDANRTEVVGTSLNLSGSFKVL